GVIPQADTVFGPVGVDETEVVTRLVFAASQAQGDPVTGTEEVVLADGATQNQACVLRKTDAGHDRTGRLLLDAVVDVDLIIRTWDLRSFYVHFLEEAQALETSLRLVDQIGRRPTTFHLAQLATQHFI